MGITKLPLDATRIEGAGQTGLRKIERLNTQPSSVQPDNVLTGRVSLLDLPPLCIPADELDTTGAEVDVRVSCNNKCGNKP